ncbi:MAG: hypothetical protein V3U10_04000 [Bacteroidota bacterium]
MSRVHRLVVLGVLFGIITLFASSMIHGAEVALQAQEYDQHRDVYKFGQGVDFGVLILIIVHAILAGIAIVWFYHITYDRLPLRRAAKGLSFAALFVVVADFPTWLSNYTTFNIPDLLAFSGTLAAVVSTFVAGIILGILYELLIRKPLETEEI